ncbi:MAG: STAS/SEC14 domain-containing protein [Agriterribacter sp.]
MIVKIENTPDNMIGFQALNNVTSDDFETLVLPEVKALVDRTGKLNYLMVIDTDLSNFTAGAWWQDALLGLKNFGSWNRAAILSDSDGIKTFTNIFSIVMPGEFKGFSKDQLEEAVVWVSSEK